MKPMEIEQRSFEIITGELTVPLQAGTEDIVKRARRISSSGSSTPPPISTMRKTSPFRRTP